MDSRPWRHLYSTKRWHRLRTAQLRDEPLCRMCQRMGYITAATVVDHIEPHKGDESLFYDRSNLQSLCSTHHDASKQRAEKRGIQEVGCGSDGWPISLDHHWNR